MINNIINVIKKETDKEEKIEKVDLQQFYSYGITQKESEVVKLLIFGKEYKEISVQLNLSINTIKKRIHNIYKKFGVRNKIELVNFFNDHDNINKI